MFEQSVYSVPNICVYICRLCYDNHTKVTVLSQDFSHALACIVGTGEKRINDNFLEHCLLKLLFL